MIQGALLSFTTRSVNVIVVDKYKVWLTMCSLFASSHAQLGFCKSLAAFFAVQSQASIAIVNHDTLALVQEGFHFLGRWERQ